MLVFSLAGAPLSISQDATRTVNLLYCHSPRSLSEGAVKDLLWWTQGPAQANGRVIIPSKVDSAIFSDASKIGWRAHFVEFSIGGRWKELEALDHINYLSWKQHFWLSDFLPLIKGSNIQFGLDNSTAVAYINQLGGTISQHLTALALDI